MQRRVAVRHPIPHQPRGRGGADSFGVIVVLQAVWNPVQRTARPTAHDLSFGSAGSRARLLGKYRDVGGETLVVAGDTREVGVDEIDRRELFRRDLPAGLSDRQI